MDHLLTHVKIQHSRRVFIHQEEVKKNLIMGDVDKGLTSFIEHKKEKEKDETDSRAQFSMYI